MTLTVELYACGEPGTPVACTVPDASLPAGAALDVRLARALALVAARLPRAVEAGDIVVAEGTRYFVTTPGLSSRAHGLQADALRSAGRVSGHSELTPHDACLV